MKFLKLIILLLLINNFTFSAEVDKKEKNEIYIDNKKLTSEIEKSGEEPNPTYSASLDGDKAISCSKVTFESGAVLYSCQLLEENGISLGLNNSDEHYCALENLYNQQENK